VSCPLLLFSSESRESPVQRDRERQELHCMLALLVEWSGYGCVYKAKPVAFGAIQ